MDLDDMARRLTIVEHNQKALHTMMSQLTAEVAEIKGGVYAGHRAAGEQLAKLRAPVALLASLVTKQFEIEPAEWERMLGQAVTAIDQQRAERRGEFMREYDEQHGPGAAAAMMRQIDQSVGE